MPVEDVLSVTPEVLIEVGKIGLWIQAVGLIVILWIVIQAVTMYFNRKRRLLLEEIQVDLARVEKKVDALSRKKK